MSHLRIAHLLQRLRHDLDEVDREIHRELATADRGDVDRELEEVRARMNALESRVDAIEQGCS